ncbi:MAG: hypothetical protein ACOZFS_08425 [Thermodesulfobacteriota bacterium]
MSDPNSHFHQNNHHKTVTECPEPKKVMISPLGWSIKGRLLWAAAASALLWLAVAWAIGRLP